MKKALVASILGLAASVVASYGQGSVIFSTYVGTVYQPIKYANPVPVGHTAGQTVGSGFFAELYFGLGSGLSFNQLTAIPSSITPVGTQVPGYVTPPAGPATTIPGYSSGAVTFAIVAFNGADWTSTLANTASGVATLPANVATWTETSIATGQNPAMTFQQNVPAITVSAVPEPATFALFGLGSAALLLFRRRK